MKMHVYDATNRIVGRLATRVAKNLLDGEEVVVVNVEKAILAGKKEMKERLYKERIRRGDPLKGPFYPRYPDGIFRRAVRGMLPWHKPKGRDAFRRLKVFVGVPEEFKNKPMEKFKEADASKLKSKYITLGELSISLGAKRKW